MTGMRIGEAAALQWSDINFETGLLSITKTLYYKTIDEYKFVEPKTQASIRTIYIDTDTIKELKAWQEVQQKVLKDCDLVLSYNGIPTSKHTLPRALEKLAGLAGVHRIKIHALRHSHASLLISMGENPLLIKERLGHEKIQTTLGTYGHLYPNTNVEVAKKLTGVLTYTPATTSVADYTSNQHTAIYHRAVELKKCNQNAILKEKSLKTLENKGFEALLQLFKLNRSRRFPRAIIQYAVYTFYLIDNSACDFSEYFPRKLC